MSLIIPDQILKLTKLTAEELKVEIAIMLYQQKRFTLGQGSRFLEISQLDFQGILEARKIPLHYNIKDLHDDIQTMKKLGL